MDLGFEQKWSDGSILAFICHADCLLLLLLLLLVMVVEYVFSAHYIHFLSISFFFLFTLIFLSTSI